MGEISKSSTMKVFLIFQLLLVLKLTATKSTLDTVDQGDKEEVFDSVDEDTFDDLFDVPFVWVDGNTEEARISVNEFILVPNNCIPQDTSISKEGHTSHVIRAVEFWRVDLSKLCSFENFDISCLYDFDSGLFSFNGLNKTFKVASSSLVRDPVRFLGIVRLGLELNFKLI